MFLTTSGATACVAPLLEPAGLQVRADAKRAIEQLADADPLFEKVRDHMRARSLRSLPSGALFIPAQNDVVTVLPSNDLESCPSGQTISVTAAMLSGNMAFVLLSTGNGCSGDQAIAVLRARAPRIWQLTHGSLLVSVSGSPGCLPRTQVGSAKSGPHMLVRRR